MGLGGGDEAEGGVEVASGGFDEALAVGLGEEEVLG